MTSPKHIRTFIWDPDLQKMVPKKDYVERQERQHMVIGPLKEFRSPITGEMITNREQLRQHNRAHGVTNSADYSQSYLESARKARHQAQQREGREDRIRTIKRAMRRS